MTPCRDPNSLTLINSDIFFYLILMTFIRARSANIILILPCKVFWLIKLRKIKADESFIGIFNMKLKLAIKTALNL